VTPPRTRLIGGVALLGATALTAATLSTLPAATADDGDRAAAGSTTARHQTNGTVRGVYDHLLELEEISAANDDQRASGTPGYEASVDYVVKKLRKAGYEPTRQAFDFPFYQQLSPSVFEQTAPTQQTFVEDTDYALMTYSGSGDVTAPVQGVDLDLDNADLSASTSGCETEDFADFVEGNIALVRRGACAFGQKATNAEAAGASGVIIMNTGTEGNTEAFAGTLGAPGYATPIVGTSFAIGQSLAAEGTEAHLVAETESEIRETWNVVAETAKGSRKNVVMAGAHLDSVVGGEGVNDNGSGSAALLETAEAMADMKKAPANRVRFAWWGAEELGLLGSEHYVADMAENQPKKFRKIALYLNFDMVGSPNYMLGVYDGDNNAFPEEESATAPEGSAAIESMFVRFFDKLGTGSVPTAFSGRSDYGPFIALNVPAGGLFTGAEGIKSEEEAALFGGTAGEAYDPCYHADCDDLGNVSRAALKANTAAIMHAVKKYARSTKSVNGTSTGHQPPPPAAKLRTVAPSDHLEGQHADESGRDYHAAPPRR
jgi:Zn-dependent M28 family amino/carboxypeptidase